MLIGAAAAAAAGCSARDTTPSATGFVSTTTVQTDPHETAREVCGLLREYVNDTADIANRAATLVSSSPDPVARRDAVLAGFDELIERSEQHRDVVGTIDPTDLYLGGPLLADLVTGAEQAIAELRDERTLFATLDGIADGDRSGRVGQFFNALEKAMSVVEPAPTDYPDDALLAALADEPTCRFVVQL